MKRSIGSLILTILLLSAAGVTAQNLLDGPEGVVYDTLYNRYLVANWDDGSVIQIDSDGVQSVFRSGLVNCSGIHIKDTLVWVCCTNRNLVGLDIESGLPVVSLPLSPYGLHDVCSDTSGFLYATNWNGNVVYWVNLSDFSFGTKISWGLTNPSGILFDAANNRLLINSFDSNGNIQAYDLNTSTLSVMAGTPFSDQDDITMDTSGHFYITTWNTNDLWVYDELFTDPPACIGSGTTMMTDVCFNPENNELALTHYGSSSIQYISLADSDTDGTMDLLDNCPDVPNADQLDDDEDGVGDICDNCPTTPNTGQDNDDQDSLGNACDNCPEVTNDDQADGDSDNVGDLCDNCRLIPNGDQANSDADTLGDACDNCPTADNDDQADLNTNDVGDACEACCGFWNEGYTGNVNRSSDGKITLSDISRLIDHVFISKEPLECPEDGNANGSFDGKITLSDITRVIDNVFISKEPTAECM